MKKEAVRQVHRPAITRRSGKERERQKEKENAHDMNRKDRKLNAATDKDPHMAESLEDQKKKHPVRRPPVICITTRRLRPGDEKDATLADNTGQLVFDSDEEESLTGQSNQTSSCLAESELTRQKPLLSEGDGSPVNPRIALQKRLTSVIERTVSYDTKPDDECSEKPIIMSSKAPVTQITKRVLTLDQTPIDLAVIRKRTVATPPTSNTVVSDPSVDIPMRRRIVTDTDALVSTTEECRESDSYSSSSHIALRSEMAPGGTRIVNDDLLRQSLDVLLEQDPEQSADHEELTARLEYKRDILQGQLKATLPDSPGYAKLQVEFKAVNHLILELHEAQRLQGLQKMQETREHQDAIVKKNKLTKEHFKATIDLTADSDEDLGEDEQLSIMVNGRKLFEKMKDYKKPPKGLNNPFDKKSGGRGNKALPSEVLISIEQKFRT